MEEYFEYGDTEIAYLRKKDKKLGAAIDRIGMIQRKVNPNLFAATIENIISQQISNKAAVTVCQRLSDISDLDSERLHALSVEEIQACGTSMRKADILRFPNTTISRLPIWQAVFPARRKRRPNQIC
jgi:3-methyladenine DNA glycosylase/8-oxoguanine DNA glycosylase